MMNTCAFLISYKTWTRQDFDNTVLDLIHLCVDLLHSIIKYIKIKRVKIKYSDVSQLHVASGIHQYLLFRDLHSFNMLFSWNSHLIDVLILLKRMSTRFEVRFAVIIRQIMKYSKQKCTQWKSHVTCLTKVSITVRWCRKPSPLCKNNYQIWC